MRDLKFTDPPVWPSSAECAPQLEQTRRLIGLVGRMRVQPGYFLRVMEHPEDIERRVGVIAHLNTFDALLPLDRISVQRAVWWSAEVLRKLSDLQVVIAVLDLLRAAAVHEVHEWFLFDGKLVIDEHAGEGV